MAKGSEKYKAERKNNKKEASNSTRKTTAKFDAKNDDDYFTSDKGVKKEDIAANTKNRNKIISSANPNVPKNLNTLNKPNAINKKIPVGEKIQSSNSNVPENLNTLNEPDAIEKKIPVGEKFQSSNPNISENLNSNKPTFNKKNHDVYHDIDYKFKDNDIVKDKTKINEEVNLFENDPSVSSKKKKKFSLIFGIAIFFLTIIIVIILTIASSSEDGKGNLGGKNNECTHTSNADESSKRQARFTTYIGSSLGGSIGNVNNYVKEGTIFYENGYAMWKGGTQSKLNGKVYGKSGTDYMIVATATEYLFGNSSGFGYTWNQVPNVAYFNYGDTFTIEVSFDSGVTYKSYNAIVLDSCGACMEWSLSAPTTWRYSPHSTNKNELKKCEVSEGYKIDLYTNSSGAKAHADMGYFLNGNSSNTCVGEVDLGDLVTGISDTQLLDRPLIELFGEDGMNELNELIASNVEKYGVGTGKGSAAAAITLINSIKAKGYRLPYYWAGGHGAISIGANPNWGSRTGGSCSSSRCYYFNSLDCSGFVSWAVRNGGCTNFSSNVAANFMSLGPSESVESAKAGDVLASKGHVLIVVQNNDGKVILAESSGGTGGVHFSEYSPSSHSNYKMVDMSGFYSSSSCK